MTRVGGGPDARAGRAAGRLRVAVSLAFNSGFCKGFSSFLQGRVRAPFVPVRTRGRRGLRAARAERVLKDASAAPGADQGREERTGEGPWLTWAGSRLRPSLGAPGGGGEGAKRRAVRRKGREEMGLTRRREQEAGHSGQLSSIHQPSRGHGEGHLAGRLRRGTELPEGGGVICRRGRGRCGAGVGEWAAWPSRRCG